MIQSIPSAAGSATGGAVGGASNLTTIGAVPYVSASGTLNQDQTANNQFFWDATNHRLGIGTASPSYPIDAKGLRVMDQTGGTGSTLAVIQAGAGQSGNLLSIRNNAGTEFASVSLAGLGTFVGVNSNGDVTLASSNQIAWGGSKSKIYSPSDGVITVWDNAQAAFSRIQLGGTTSSFPAIKRSSAGIDFRLADDSAYTTVQASLVQTAGTTVASLPAAAAGNAGSRAYVTDANATTIGSTVAGGGANKVLVWSNGTAWKIYAS